MENEVFAVEMRGISKSFGKVRANDHVDLKLKKGEILALLGENGSGKTTLMNMLSGIYYQDEGEVFVDGCPVSIRSPKDAFAHGIGMVHQHYLLVNVFTAAENIVLGTKIKGSFSNRKVNEQVREIVDRYGFDLDPKKKIYDMSVAEKQTVEIVKVLYRGAKILILDEPTAVLTPQETQKLFQVLFHMKKDGKSIIIITHKLNEVLEVSDRVEILRHGSCVETVRTEDATVNSLTEAMVGKKMELKLERPETQPGPGILRAEHLRVRNSEQLLALDDVSFALNGGEILGVAGISGSGQKELCDVVAGLIRPEKGKILFRREGGEKDEMMDLLTLSEEERRKAGISHFGAFAYVPEDRLGMGLVASMGMTDNMLLRTYNREKGILADRKTPNEMAKKLIQDLEIKTPGTEVPVRRLSGGNVQKVLLGREIMCMPQLLIVSYPTRGLDIMSSYKVFELVNEQKKKGVAVLYIGEDLDVLMELCDRIMVLCGGKVSGILDARKTTKEEIGLLMTGTIQTETREESVYPKRGEE